MAHIEVAETVHSLTEGSGPSSASGSLQQRQQSSDSRSHLFAQLCNDEVAGAPASSGPWQQRQQTRSYIHRQRQCRSKPGLPASIGPGVVHLSFCFCLQGGNGLLPH